MAPKVTIVGLASQKLKYMELMATCGAPPGSNKHDALIADATAGLINVAHSMRSITPDEAVELKAVLEGKIPEPNVLTVMQAVNAKVSLAAGLAGGGIAEGDKISVTHLDACLLPDEWTRYEDKNGNQDVNLMSMAMTFARLGLAKKANERTCAYGALLATMGLGFEPTRLLQATRDLKKI